MAMTPGGRRPIGRQKGTPTRRTKAPSSPVGLPLPHERDESTQITPRSPDPVMAQAKHDIDAGMVDTDLRGTPGQDAQRRARLVPGPGGASPPPDD